MPKYLFEIRYTASGANGLLAEGGTARAEVARKAIEGVGGRMESFHFAFGDTDAYIVAVFPDEAAAAAVALTVSGAGGVTAKTIVLLDPETLDRTRELTVPYRIPGG